MRKLHDLAVRHEAWLTVACTAVEATLLGLWTGILSSGIQPGQPLQIADRVLTMGWLNLMLIASILVVTLHAYLVRVTRKSGLAAKRKSGLKRARAILDLTIALLTLRKPSVTYRALVTVADRGRKTRKTIIGVNIGTDPELALSVPADFGVSGLAFTTAAMQSCNLSTTTRDVAPDGSVVPGIWTQVACVVSFPLVDKGGVVVGTVNFDSNADLARSLLGDRKVQEVLSRVTKEVNRYVNDYGEP